jgi:hypothetical protein
MTLRALSDDAFGDMPGPTVFLKLQDNDQAPFSPQRAIDADDWVRDILQTVPKKRDATGVFRGDVLVFIHGYNNAMDAVLERHRLLKQNLASYGFAGTVISFDWPCDDIALAYLSDRRQAKQTATLSSPTGSSASLRCSSCSIATSTCICWRIRPAPMSCAKLSTMPTNTATSMESVGR